MHVTTDELFERGVLWWSVQGGGGYKEDNWRIGSWKGAVVRRGLDIVRSRNQATTSEDTAGCKRQRDYIKCGNNDSVMVTCSYNLYVVSESNLQCKTPSTVTPYYMTILQVLVMFLMITQLTFSVTPGEWFTASWGRTSPFSEILL
jgi:hypothetical protein